jgi:glycosyltransferase involved in cell wall biosynthesis
VRFRFLTSTPLDVRRGSGTYVGMAVLARALRELGHTVAFETPRVHLPVYTFERMLFNAMLKADPEFDITVGFDLDGYRIAGNGAHVAALKGVIADEVRFESGLTRFTMAMQARRERIHVRRAARVLATSRYSAGQACEFYGLKEQPSIVPELIDLVEWRKLLAGNPAESTGLTVLFAGRFYHRKRVDVLLRAAALWRKRLPDVQLRIVGNGPCNTAWRRLAGELQLGEAVVWLGDVTRAELAAEFNRASVFCLPSVQEGFGIVLLEAMAAGKPVVAARAAAIPEVVPHGLLAEPDNPEALRAGIEELYQSSTKRAELIRLGTEWVEQFDAPRVARLFVEAVAGAGASRYFQR